MRTPMDAGRTCCSPICEAFHSSKSHNISVLVSKAQISTHNLVKATSSSCTCESDMIWMRQCGKKKAVSQTDCPASLSSQPWTTFADHGLRTTAAPQRAHPSPWCQSPFTEIKHPCTKRNRGVPLPSHRTPACARSDFLQLRVCQPEAVSCARLTIREHNEFAPICGTVNRCQNLLGLFSSQY